jgi:hypothetical protein
VPTELAPSRRLSSFANNGLASAQSTAYNLSNTTGIIDFEKKYWPNTLPHEIQVNLTRLAALSWNSSAMLSLQKEATFPHLARCLAQHPNTSPVFVVLI